MDILAWEIINKLCDQHLQWLMLSDISNELKLFLDILNILD
jgi:hypothetical protein